MKHRVWTFILNGKRPEACADILRWGLWMESNHRHVAKTDVGECFVSTVFLGADHAWMSGEPVLFETMAFGPPETAYNTWLKRDHTSHPEIGSMRRYTTWEAAERGHAEIVREVEELLKDNEKTARDVLKSIAERET